MLKYLSKIFLFLTINFFVYLILLFAWYNFLPASLKKNIKYPLLSYGHTFSRLQEVKSVENIDVLFIGSSHAYRGFDNRIFDSLGIKTFNLGSLAQTPIQSKLLLERYISTLNPKIIVYEVYPYVFTTDGVESSLDIIANDQNDCLSAEMVIKQKNIKVFNTFVYDEFLGIFRDKNSFNEKLMKYSDKYIYGGFVEKKIRFFKKIKYDLQKWNFNNEQFENFESILRIISEKNIKIVLVQAPITKNLYNSYANNKDFDAIMNNYGEYYNYNEILQLDDSLNFYDAHHLNQYGVRLFNNDFIKRYFGSVDNSQ